MSLSATCSRFRAGEPGAARSNAEGPFGRVCGRSVRSAGGRVIPFLLILLAAGPSATAAVLMTQDEALSEAFPGAEVERLTEYLDEEQAARAADLAGSELASRLVIRYRATREGKRIGTAYFDTHVVRTVTETLMIVIGPDGRVSRVDVLSFDEPTDYLPRPAWYDQFDGRQLDPELSLRRGIRAVTGATLSSRAATAAVRRALAIDRILTPPSPPEKTP